MPVGYEKGLVVTITGHRAYPDRGALYRGLDAIRAQEYYIGGANGVDSDALEHLARTQSGSLRTVVVPNRLSDQPILARSIIRQNASRVIELRNSGPDRYMIRNRYMVDRSTRVSAFYDFRGSGGTYNTIEYSRSIGRQVTINPMISYDMSRYREMSQAQLRKWIQEVKRRKVGLSTIKRLLLDILKDVHHVGVAEFAAGFGYSDVTTLEQLWRR